MNKKLKEYFELERQLRQLSKRVLREKVYVSSVQKLPLYLTEIYFRSRRISEIIEAIRKKAAVDFNKKNVDELLTHFVELRIEIYDETIDWMKSLRNPLRIFIRATDDMLSNAKAKLRKQRGRTHRSVKRKPRGA